MLTIFVFLYGPMFIVSGSTNFIENGFYDVGQLRQETKFLTLDDYARQELNDKRPIILINAKPE